jgi:predicted nucleotidyltransferase
MTSHNQTPRLEDVLETLRAAKPELLQRWGVRELAVFGSVARGEATPASDVDILFDYDRELGLEIVTLGDYLEERLGRKVDLLSKKAVRPKVWPYIKGDMRYV